MQDNGLKVAVPKTEVVLIMDRRSFVPPQLEQEGERIE